MADDVASRLTAKAGPLPVWGWAALIVGAYLAYTHFKGSPAAASTSGTPASAAIDQGAVAGTSGNGNAADNINSELLSALLQGQSQGYDALTTALQNQNGYSTTTTGSYNTTTNNSTTNYGQSTGGGTSSGPPPGGGGGGGGSGGGGGYVDVFPSTPTPSPTFTPGTSSGQRVSPSGWQPNFSLPTAGTGGLALAGHPVVA